MIRPLAVIALILMAASSMVMADDDQKRDAIFAAAKALGCEPRNVRELTLPHDGVQEVACDGGMYIWLYMSDGKWTLRPHG